MTITERIFAAHSGKKNVSAGELINAKVDLVLANDITAPIAISEFKKRTIQTTHLPDAAACF